MQEPKGRKGQSDRGLCDQCHMVGLQARFIGDLGLGRDVNP